MSMEGTKKRVRDDDSSNHSSDYITDRLDSPDSKIRRLQSSDSVFDPEVQLQDDIFDILDEADNVPERDSVQGLDSVIKSFEDEINAPSHPTQMPDSGELQTNLGYLLEASDDELGLPPTEVSGEETGRVDPEIAEMTGLMGFEYGIPSYDAFGFGSGFTPESDGAAAAGDFVPVDGLFDYAEPAADVLWRSESLQAT